MHGCICIHWMNVYMGTEHTTLPHAHSSMLHALKGYRWRVWCTDTPLVPIPKDLHVKANRLLEFKGLLSKLSHVAAGCNFQICYLLWISKSLAKHFLNVPHYRHFLMSLQGILNPFGCGSTLKTYTHTVFAFLYNISRFSSTWKAPTRCGGGGERRW